MVNIKVIALIIPVILVVCVAAPLVIEYGSSDDSSLQYDDYFLTDAISAEGSLELVNYNGQSYAHARSIGEGKLTYSDNSTTTYNVEKAKLFVLYLTGQSNSAYNTIYAQVDVANQELTHIDAGHAYYYGDSSIPVQAGSLIMEQSVGPWDLTPYSMQSMTSIDGNYRIGHIEAALASRICSESDYKLYVINGGQNGRSISAWVGNGNGMALDLQILSDAVNKIDTNLYDYTLGGYIWLQGEADANKSVDWYVEQFTGVNQTFNNNHLVPCYMIQVNKSVYPNPAIAQEQIAETNPDVYLASASSQTFTVDNGLLWPDSTAHYTQKGYDIVGIETADVILSHNPGLIDVVDKALSPFIPAIIIVLILLLVVLVAGTMIYKTN